MRKCFFSLMLIGMIILAAAPGAQSAELVMVERDGCAWCAAFDREIAPVYGKTEEGRRAPLRRIELGHTPSDIGFVAVDRFTPEFIMVDRGREIGRIRGYPGPEGFWTQLAMLMRELDAAAGEQQASNPVLPTD